MDGRTVTTFLGSILLSPMPLDCDCTPVGPAGQQVFVHYVIWGLKHLLARDRLLSRLSRLG